MKKNKLKYLSESILLEESGLPMINTITILSITIMIILFLTWANYMIIDDTVSVNGYVYTKTTNSNNYMFISLVPSKNISVISEEDPVLLSIPGITNRRSINAYVATINRTPQVNEQGRVFYEVTLNIKATEEMNQTLTTSLLNGMETRSDIIVGSRTLLQYLLGPLWDVGQKAFSSNG